MSILPVKAKFKIRSLSGKIYFTIDDISHLPEFPEGPLIEILEGDLYMVPSPTIIHQTISRKLTLLIGKYLQDKNLGELYYAPTDVILSEENVVIPDLFVILKNNLAIIKEKNIQGSPNLIIEILSSNRLQDLEKKKALYEKYQITEYWILDPLEKTILVFKLTNKGYGSPIIYEIENNLSSSLIPQLKIPLREIFG